MCYSRILADGGSIYLGVRCYQSSTRYILRNSSFAHVFFLNRSGAEHGHQGSHCVNFVEATRVSGLCRTSEYGGELCIYIYMFEAVDPIGY